MAPKKGKKQTSFRHNSKDGVKSSLKKPHSSSSNGGHDPDERFEIEAIVGDRIYRSKRQYKIHWKGYPTNEDTWENVSNLECTEMVVNYEITKQLKGRKSIIANNNKEPLSKQTNGQTNKHASKQEIPSPKDYRKPEKIVAVHLLANGKREVLIRWKNLKETHDSWIPEAVFVGTDIHRIFLIKEKQILTRKLAFLKW